MLMKTYLIYFLLLFTSFAYGQTNINQIFKKYGVKGSTTIYNQNKRKWLYSDSLDAMRETLPLSTFNIINSCIALESGAIRTETEIIAGSNNNQSNLNTAFKKNNIIFFQNLSKKIGKKDYLEFMKACNYGNAGFTETGNDFWNKGPLRISPTGQINFLRTFLREQLPFSPRTFRVVKELMITQKNDNYILLDQPGVSTAGNDFSWYIGAVKIGDNAFYFATRILKSASKTKAATDNLAKVITKDILKQLKITN